MPAQTEETLYLAEQRRFRRLEASLPVWLAVEDEFDRPGAQPWTLGYTRDISMGGSKIFVPSSEEVRWREVRQRGGRALLRFDAPGVGTEEYIVGRVRHTAHDEESGNLWLGVEYDEGAEQAKSASVRAGLASVRGRRRWQGMLVLALAVIGLGFVAMTQLQTQSRAQQQKITQLQQQRQQLYADLNKFSQPGIVGTRAEGMTASYQRKDIQKQIRDIAQNSRDNGAASTASDEANKQAVAASSNAVVNLGIALPYGYAWPQVTGDVEQLLGRRIPTVVIFRDFKAPFPLADCRQARVGAKTLQITWEPWRFEDPKTNILPAILSGKYDSYIDSWAQAAKSFGGEVWIRWGHEFNGNWYPWCTADQANGQSPQNYIAAFRHIRDRFNSAGAFNARWVWCLNAETVPNVGWNDPLRAYPGDNYVDMISIDGYNFGTALPSSHWETFDEIFSSAYQKVVNSGHRKPIMINEVGCATVGGDKVSWLHDMDVSLRKHYPRVEGVVWFEAQKEANWLIESSPESLQACKQVWNQPYYRRGEP